MSSSATMLAGTFVNTVQASKRAMREPTLLRLGEGRRQVGKKSDRDTELDPPG